MLPAPMKSVKGIAAATSLFNSVRDVATPLGGNSREFAIVETTIATIGCGEDASFLVYLG